jgi:glycerate 2-kinase
VDLKATYLTTLARCAPDVLVRDCVRDDMPRHVVAIGKCASALLDGVASVHEIESAFVAVPEGYPLPREVERWPLPAAEALARARRPKRPPLHLFVGGHPHYTRESFAAGRALVEYVDAHEDILFLVSGGGSACVEVPLIDEAAARQKNAEWIASGMTIAEINAERRTISAIKGGKLAARVRGRAVTLVYSDVSTGALHDVASGPTVPGSEAVLIADNTTLVKTAAQIIGDNAVVVEEQVEGDVLDAAAMLAARARELRKGQVLVAGGEPTVVVRGNGRGGRCSELAVRFAGLCGLPALFGSSDGVDGNSGVAGIYLPGGLKPALPWVPSDSFPVAAQIGEPIMIAPTGNNLRDLFFVACV